MKQILFNFKSYCNLVPGAFSMECGRGTSVILLQIIMVSPGTHFVKNHESQLKKTTNPKLKMVGPLCNQTEDRLQTSLLQYT